MFLCFRPISQTDSGNFTNLLLHSEQRANFYQNRRDFIFSALNLVILLPWNRNVRIAYRHPCTKGGHANML
ncbi:hypothetical protein XENTR_v10013363 [Xenopus tropicalis]|nr:hypothetical protein XENTR_v10013363 [Xenopus tropicalis]